jgi:hypothetical protein
VHRAVRNHTLTLKVSVPQAGRLSATGKGLTSAAKSAAGRQMLTLKLKERRAGRLRSVVIREPRMPGLTVLTQRRRS